jgi:hypothetical protein
MGPDRVPYDVTSLAGSRAVWPLEAAFVGVLPRWQLGCHRDSIGAGYGTFLRSPVSSGWLIQRLVWGGDEIIVGRIAAQIDDLTRWDHPELSGGLVHNAHR